MSCSSRVQLQRIRSVTRAVSGRMKVEYFLNGTRNQQTGYPQPFALFGLSIPVLFVMRPIFIRYETPSRHLFLVLVMLTKGNSGRSRFF
jgi:hypothetical protein